jgi:carbonic anhydrase/acetyltransferase-like protein (isoleucine patch superfamily)
MSFYEFEGKSPVLDPSCFIHPDAILVGDVTIGKQCFIGAGAVLRGDYGSIVISDGANVQENCTIHAQPGTVALIGENVDVGHGSIIHGPCSIGTNVTIGMGSTICDNCTIGSNCFIGAGSVLPSKLVIPDGKLAFGNPAKVNKDTTEFQRNFTKMAIDIYKDLCVRYHNSFKPITDPSRLYRRD